MVSLNKMLMILVGLGLLATVAYGAYTVWKMTQPKAKPDARGDISLYQLKGIDLATNGAYYNFAKTKTVSDPLWVYDNMEMKVCSIQVGHSVPLYQIGSAYYNEVVLPLPGSTYSPICYVYPRSATDVYGNLVPVYQHRRPDGNNLVKTTYLSYDETPPQGLTKGAILFYCVKP